jgi:hypothetical protein
MNREQDDRLVVSFEKIASSLGGIYEEVRRAGRRHWPQPREQKQAVQTRVETDEDRIRKSQGASNLPIGKWLDPNFEEPEEEFVGERTRQWFRDHPKEKAKAPDASAEAASTGKPNIEGFEEVKG